MQTILKKILKFFIPGSILKLRSTYLSTRLSLKPIAKRTCNICNFEGWFDRFGIPPRLDAQCPKCASLERHRLLMLTLSKNSINLDINEKTDHVLHFAAEPILEKIFRKKYKNYKTADLYNNADLKLNLEEMTLPNDTYKLIIANHVLEHVNNDKKAASELSRILTKDGILIVMVPIIEGWNKTYENPQITSDEERTIHFGQRDHVRCYGRDFRERIKSGGLKLAYEITAEGQNVINFGLLRGEKVFVFTKS